MRYFEWDKSVFYLLFCVVLPFLLTGIFYYRSQIVKEQMKTSKKLVFFLFLLRFTTLFLILFLIGNPVVKRYYERVELPIVAVLFDNSSSVRYLGQDTSLIKSKIADLRAFQNEEFKLDIYGFDQVLVPADSIRFNGLKTNFTSAINEVELRYRNNNLSELIIVSDGIVNEGFKDLNNKFLNLTISTVALGDSIAKKDIVLEGFYHNDVTYLGNFLQVKSSWFCQSLSGQKLRLELLLNDSVIKKKEFEIKRDQYYVEWDDQLMMDTEGVQKLAVKAYALPGEVTVVNNVKTAFVEVREKKQKIVLLYGVPHPDIKTFVSCYTDDSEYEVELVQFNQLKSAKIDADLLVIYDRPQGKREQQLVSELLESNRLNKLLFYPQSNEVKISQTAGDELYSSNRVNETGAKLNLSFGAFQMDEQEYQWLKAAPPLLSPYGNYSFASSHQVLLKQVINGVETELPLVSFRDLEFCREGHLFAEGWWKWSFNSVKKTNGVENEVVKNFIKQLVRYLMAGDNHSPLELIVQDWSNAYEDLLIKANVYDESRKKVIDPEINLLLQDESGHQRSFTFLNEQNHSELRIPGLSAGNYVLEASTILNGKKVVKKKKLIVRNDDIESRQLIPDHDLLKKLAASHQGSFAYFDKTDELFNEITKKEKVQKSYFDYLSESLIHWKILFFIMVLMLGMEWFMRKYNGHV